MQCTMKIGNSLALAQYVEWMVSPDLKPLGIMNQDILANVTTNVKNVAKDLKLEKTWRLTLADMKIQMSLNMAVGFATKSIRKAQQEMTTSFFIQGKNPTIAQRVTINVTMAAT